MMVFIQGIIQRLNLDKNDTLLSGSARSDAGHQLGVSLQNPLPQACPPFVCWGT